LRFHSNPGETLPLVMELLVCPVGRLNWEHFVLAERGKRG
jgi:hypothetical protein